VQHHVQFLQSQIRLRERVASGCDKRGAVARAGRGLHGQGAGKGTAHHRVRHRRTGRSVGQSRDHADHPAPQGKISATALLPVHQRPGPAGPRRRTGGTRRLPRHGHHHGRGPEDRRPYLCLGPGRQGHPPGGGRGQAASGTPVGRHQDPQGTRRHRQIQHHRRPRRQRPARAGNFQGAVGTRRGHPKHHAGQARGRHRLCRRGRTRPRHDPRPAGGGRKAPAADDALQALPGRRRGAFVQ